MKNFLKKIIDDTLKNKEGKWSRKSLTVITSFILAIFVGLWIVLKGHSSGEALSVFYGFLALGGGSLGLTVIDKIKKV